MSGAVVVMQQNRALRRFRDASATDASRAQRPADLSVRENWIFRRMVGRGVFVEVPGGGYYLDEAEAAQFIRRRQRIAWIVCVLGLISVLVIFAW